MKGQESPKSVHRDIELILDGNHDITEKPSCCRVSSGWEISFQSLNKFSVNFGISSPFVETGPIDSNTTMPLHIRNIGAGVYVFRYTVTLYDSHGHRHRDSHCPTIIVGN